MNYDHILPVEKLKLHIKIGLGLFVASIPAYFWFKCTQDFYVFILAWGLFLSSSVFGGLNGLALFYRLKNLPIPVTRNEISDSGHKIIYIFSELIIFITGLFLPVVLKVYF